MKRVIMSLVLMGAVNAQAISQEDFAALAMKTGGALVAECPSKVVTKDDVLSSGITAGIYKVSTQSKINGSKASAYVVNPSLKLAQRGCIYKLQKVDVTKSGNLTLKNN